MQARTCVFSLRHAVRRSVALLGASLLGLAAIPLPVSAQMAPLPIVPPPIVPIPRPSLVLQRMNNPGFEVGLAGWTITVDNDQRRHGAVALSTYAHCGTQGVAFGQAAPTASGGVSGGGFTGGGTAGGAANSVGVPMAGSSIRQLVSIPLGSPGASLELWVRLRWTYAVADRDTLRVGVSDPSLSYPDGPDVELANLSTAAFNLGTWTHVGPYDLSRFVGKTITVGVGANTSSEPGHGAIFDADDIHVFTSAGYTASGCM